MKKPSMKIAAFTLFTFLLSGIGTTSLFPILIASLAHAHPVFFSEGHNKIQLVLHHSGNHDEHEAREVMAHRHDLLDIMIGFSKSDPLSHTDHTVELPAFEEKISTTTKNSTEFHPISFLANVHILPLSVQQKLEAHLPRFLPVIDPHRTSLRTNILVI